MNSLKKYQDKKIAIYGLGKTGVSAAKTLKKLKAEILCWDDNKKTRKNAKNLNFPLNKFWVNNKFIDYILISPGININKCKIKKFLKNNLNKIITDLDIFLKFYNSLNPSFLVKKVRQVKYSFENIYHA